MLQRTDSLGVPVSIVNMRTAVAEVPSYLEARDIQVPQQAPARRKYVGLRDLLRLVTDNVLFHILGTVAMVRQGTTGVPGIRARAGTAAAPAHDSQPRTAHCLNGRRNWSGRGESNARP